MVRRLLDGYGPASVSGRWRPTLHECVDCGDRHRVGGAQKPRRRGAYGAPGGRREWTGRSTGVLGGTRWVAGFDHGLDDPFSLPLGAGHGHQLGAEVDLDAGVRLDDMDYAGHRLRASAAPHLLHLETMHDALLKITSP